MNKLFILGLVLLAVCAANAIPTLTGPTGGFELPTAGIAPKGVTAAIDLATSSSGVAWPDTRAQFGFNQDLEVGAMYQSIQTMDGKKNIWNINGKYLLPLAAKDLKLAVGAMYGETVVTHPWAIYAAGTMPLMGTDASASLAYASSTGSNDRNGFTLGLADEKSMNKDTAIGAEILFGDKTGIFAAMTNKTHINLYLTHTVTSNFSARIAYAGLLQNTGIYLGGCYTFDAK